MSPPRKKPLCHTCGLPMAGHKRPNGSPICPKIESLSRSMSPRRSPLKRTNLSDIPFEIPPDGTLHRRNPNYVEPPSAPESDAGDYDDEETGEENLEASWVPTELADNEYRYNAHGQPDPETMTLLELDKTDDGDDDAQSDGSPSHAQPVSSRIRRSFSSFLMTSTPIASLLSIPKDNIPALADAARQRGLFMALLPGRLGGHDGRRIKRESDDGGSQPALAARPSSRLVVMGRDAEAVDLLLDHGLQGQVGSHEARLFRQSGIAGAYPVDARSIRMTFLDVVVAGAVGGLLVWYVLSIF